jgi:hypothetical protein
MKRSTLVAAAAFAGTIGLTGAAAAQAQATTTSDGPYSYSSIDYGQCGNAWANEAGNRSFTQGGSSNTNTIRESFTRVHWSTLAGLAPGDLQANEDGSCAVAADTVANGVTGSMRGYVTLIIQGAPYDAKDGTCAGQEACTTNNYIAYHYAGATRTDGAYKFTYRARNSGTLAVAISNDRAWVENCPTACANNGYDEQNYSQGNIATSE